MVARSWRVPPRGTRRFFEGGFAGFLSEAPPAPPTRRAPPFLPEEMGEKKGRGLRLFKKEASHGFSSKAPPAPSTPAPQTGAVGGGGLYGQGKDRAGIAARFVGTSYGSLASPQAAKLIPSTVPLLPSRHCDSRAKLARQSRRSFFPARFIRHWRRFAGKLSPPNPLRWASAGAPLLVSLQALPRLGWHASGLPRKP